MHRYVLLISFVGEGLSYVSRASGDTTSAHAANAGWIDFAPASGDRVVASDHCLRGYAYAANFGWIDFGDGTPANGSTYANMSATDCGVNHNGRGELSGYAYAANVGWINFSWAGATDPDRPRVDLVTGAATGFAYGANIGWINLNGLTIPGCQASIDSPAGRAPTAGGSFLLSADVAGDEALSFQWLLNGIAIAGATGNAYAIPSVQRFHAGAYSVRVTRGDGSSIDLASATVTVGDPAPSNSRLLNLSTRGLSLTNDQVLIPGFVVSGTGTKRLLVRAVGPTLSHAPYNVGGTLADPRLALKRLNFATSPPSYEDVGRNDNWASNPNAAAIATAMQDLGAFPFEDDREAALLVDLAPGQYTVVADGAAGATGIAIVELYDADSATSPGQALPATLVNISNRGFCGVGAQVMIPGFVVSSEGPKTVLVRVVGPALGGFGVPGTMTNPKLQVFPVGAATPILENDDWGDTADAANTVQVAQQVFAFPLAAGSRDAAFVVSLPPGSYTVVGSAADGVSTGVVLVEVYVVE